MQTTSHHTYHTVQTVSYRTNRIVPYKPYREKTYKPYSTHHYMINLNRKSFPAVLPILTFHEISNKIIFNYLPFSISIMLFDFFSYIMHLRFFFSSKTVFFCLLWCINACIHLLFFIYCFSYLSIRTNYHVFCHFSILFGTCGC